LSTLSVCSVREVAAELNSPFWLQLYMIKDRGFLKDMLAHGREAGCSALLLTVDLPVSGSRYRDVRSGLSVPAGAGASFRRFCQSVARPGWAWQVGIHGRPHSLGNLEPVLGTGTGLGDYFGWIGENFDPSISWDDLAWLRGQWPGPIVIKGILDPEDAAAAVDHGADGIVVSNHGGRQLDGAMSTALALPAVVEAVSARIPDRGQGPGRSLAATPAPSSRFHWKPSTTAATSASASTARRSTSACPRASAPDRKYGWAGRARTATCCWRSNTPHTRSSRSTAATSSTYCR
jgi:L-lactate dehydrogenase (cytochrome)